jgi:hypothetical protein
MPVQTENQRKGSIGEDASVALHQCFSIDPLPTFFTEVLEQSDQIERIFTSRASFYFGNILLENYVDTYIK